MSKNLPFILVTSIIGSLSIAILTYALLQSKYDNLIPLYVFLTSAIVSISVAIACSDNNCNLTTTTKATEKTRSKEEMGEAFENYVLSMFPESSFGLIQRAINKDPISGRDLRSKANPDFKLIDKKTNAKFWIECKYRNFLNMDDSLTWCNQHQFYRYKEIREKTDTKIYVIVGLKGTPEKPENLYCMDLDKIKYSTLFSGVYENYKISKSEFESYEDMLTKIS